MKASVIGTGSALPKTVVKNDDFKQWVDTDDEWIYSHTGIKERRIAKDETLISLAADAAKKALADAGVSGEEIDLIIAATFTPDCFTPTLACMLQNEVGATCPAFDLNAACSGFIYALDVGYRYIKSGAAKKVLIVAADMLSRVTNFSDRGTCVLFGDGAGAAVLSAQGEGNIIYSKTEAESDTKFSLRIPGLYSRFPLNESLPKEESVVSMDGNEIYMNAVRTMTRDIKKALSESGLTISDIDYIVPHQANSRIIDAVAIKLKMLKEKFFMNMPKYGNTSAASVAIALDELSKSGMLRKGTHVALCAFGGGFTSGCAILEWAK
ncbi:MAG: beta-ketoacyl-ACP synthase III [Bacillota bacterium]|nr:beta-ketoacyl-ACP synthase III [Bacillota bacterium]